jgi:hypothetical protein
MINLKTNELIPRFVLVTLTNKKKRQMEMEKRMKDNIK